MTRTALWMATALLLVGAVGCGAGGSREEAQLPETVVQAASEDPRLPEGEVRNVDLGELHGRCAVTGACGGLVAVDCGSVVDGPLYYVEASSGRIVEYCGGSCMMGPSPDSPYCRNCPALGWTCEGPTP